MTSRERLVSAARGGEVNPKPVILWPDTSAESDALIVKPNDVPTALDAHPDKAVLGEVLSPFARALQFRLPLTGMLRDEPDQGVEELERLIEVTRQDMDLAILGGADGIFYRLQGATPDFSTPMEYGGFYLERDRELLEGVADARCNVLFIEGDEAYLDFVSDLPAHFLAWSGGQNVQGVRRMRGGALAAPDPDAEALFITSREDLYRLTPQEAPSTN